MQWRTFFRDFSKGKCNWFLLFIIFDNLVARLDISPNVDKPILTKVAYVRNGPPGHWWPPTSKLL
jgi:hypothetical protein